MSTGLIQALQTLREQHGNQLDNEIIVEAATSPDHPLHAYFDWDDSVAGHRWRLHQASQLLRVTFRPDPTRPVDLRAFVAVKRPDSQRSDYVPVEEAMADPVVSAIVLASFKREWQVLRRRYQHLEQFAEIIQRDLHGEAS